MGYEDLAEFHDLFMAEAWERLRPVVDQAFTGLDQEQVVVDLGAGSGLGTMCLLQSCAAAVWSVEPSHTARAVLLHRVAAQESARGRVSVVAGAIPEALAQLPRRIDGVLLTHVLGHLEPGARATLWDWIAETLTARGRVLVTWQRPEPEDEGDLPDPVVEEVTLGAHLYRATHSGSGDRFASTYDVCDAAGRVIRSARAEGSWITVDRSLLEHEARAAGLLCRDTQVDGVALLTHAEP